MGKLAAKLDNADTVYFYKKIASKIREQIYAKLRDPSDMLFKDLLQDSEGRTTFST